MKDYTEYRDMELVALLAKGDNMAFREVYSRYNQLLYIFAYSKLKNDAEAQDVVHDVFVWLLEKGHQLDLKTSLSSYLYKSVLHKVYDIFRKQDVFQRYVDAKEYYVQMDTTGTDYLIREKDITQLIEKSISEMPPRMQEVYILKYRSHLSNEQIGEQLHISPQTVKTHLKHATRHMKDKLGLIVFIVHLLQR